MSGSGSHLEWWWPLAARWQQLSRELRWDGTGGLLGPILDRHAHYLQKQMDHGGLLCGHGMLGMKNALLKFLRSIEVAKSTFVISMVSGRHR
jgi:hypothetical protein